MEKIEAGVFAPPPRTAPQTEEVQHSVWDSGSAAIEAIVTLGETSFSMCKIIHF